MASVSLTAGALSVDVRSDEQGDDEESAESAEELAEIAQECMEWQMRQWSEVSGLAIETEPPGFLFK